MFSSFNRILSSVLILLRLYSGDKMMGEDPFFTEIACPCALSYEEFYQQYLVLNKPCILRNRLKSALRIRIVDPRYKIVQYWMKKMWFVWIFLQIFYITFGTVFCQQSVFYLRRNITIFLPRFVVAWSVKRKIYLFIYTGYPKKTQR